MFTDIHDFQYKAFTLIIIISWTLYACLLLGISTKAPIYLNTLDYYVKIYISLFLLWRFNMFRTIKFTELDRKIAFSAGLFLFATTAINQYLTQYLTVIQTWTKSKLGLPKQ